LKDEFRSFQDKLYTALAGRENLVAPPGSIRGTYASI